MARRTKRKSGLDAFVERAALWVAVALAVIFAVSILITEQPIIAAGIAALIVLVPTVLFILRRRARRQEARRHVEQAQHLGQLLTVSGEAFEDITADLFRSLGYRDVERIGGSGDLGVDLQATSPDGLSVVIQCKRYGSGQKVGSPAVQSLMGTVVNSGADLGIFVTTSTFTAPAIQHAETGRVPIRLIDGAELTQLAKQAARAGE